MAEVLEGMDGTCGWVQGGEGGDVDVFAAATAPRAPVPSAPAVRGAHAFTAPVPEGLSDSAVGSCTAGARVGDDL